MEISPKQRLFVAWLVLVAITVMYLWIDRGGDEASTAVTVAAIVLALVKFRIIVRELMDVRHAPAILRRITDGLALLIGVALLGTYLVGHALA